MEEPRQIWLCADDYGISHSVNKAIRDLIMRGRLNATSVMTPAACCDRADTTALNMLNADMKRAALGLHLTLTAPFKPMSAGFAPTRDGAFLPVKEMLRAAMLRRLDRKKLALEVATQLHAFATAFGCAPDYVDGHMHVHLFPQVRDVVLDVMADVAPKAWVRQCGRTNALNRRLDTRKAILFDILSVRFRSKARRHGIAYNPGFAGAYDYTPEADFARLFPRFLDGLPDGGLVMCHPGFIDAELKRVDLLTTHREREFAYLNGDEFPRALSANNVSLKKAA